MALAPGVTFYRSLTVSPLPRARGCDRLEFRVRTDYDVCQFLWQDGASFVRMIRDIDSFLLEELGDPNYHLEFISEDHEKQLRQAQAGGKRRQPQLGFRAQVAYNNPVLRPPKPRKACISCESDNPISALSFYGRSQQCNIWLDGKARANTPFIVTPFRHLDSLAEMRDDEILDMYRQASLTILKSPANPAELISAAAMKELSLSDPTPDPAAAAKLASAEPVSASSEPAGPAPEAAAPCVPEFFQPHILILNQGNFRNLAHIHLKVRLSTETFLAVREPWTPDLYRRWSRLEDLSSDKALMADFVGGGAVSRPKLPIPPEIQRAILEMQEAPPSPAQVDGIVACGVEPHQQQQLQQQQQ